VTGRSVNRASFTAAIWKYFEEDYSLFLRARSLAPVREAYEEGLVNKGRTVRVLDPAGPFTGTAGGITDTGEMIVTPRAGGPDRIISSGEVSVRGVEGYV
jgi:BirA family biotin operon repressor/biotin-[acetyl-CoA-carboxylase] ligase